jgi:hypothetical protein
MLSNKLNSRNIFLVQGTFIDPIPGFIDTIMGFTAFGLGNLIGVLRVLYVKSPLGCLNYVPADCTVNSILAICCQRLTSGCKSNIFNCVGADEILFTFCKICTILFQYNSYFF